MVLETDLCVRARVALSGLNIVSEAGLYNSTRGTATDFIFKSVCRPKVKHGDHLPFYIIVDFPSLKSGNAEQWDSNKPTVSATLIFFFLIGTTCS